MEISTSFLRDHGIQLQQGEFERLFIDAVKHYSLRTRAETSDLDEAELAALSRGGLGEEVDFTARDKADPLGQTAADYAALVATALPAARAARVLGVDTSRIRQRLGSEPRTLYGVKHRRSWRLPRFQFDDGGNDLIPGIELVLPHLDPELHPLSVALWFTTRHPDLTPGDMDEPLSPRDWLRLGYDPATVASLAADL